MEKYSIRTAESEPLLEGGTISHGIEDDGSLPQIKTFDTPEEALKAALVLRDQEKQYLSEMVGDTEIYVYSELEDSKYFHEPLLKTGNLEYMRDSWREKIGNALPPILKDSESMKRDPNTDKSDKNTLSSNKLCAVLEAIKESMNDIKGPVREIER